ncbi:MAG: bifunctional aspartate kinase/diaminopimelate decarboxylase [Arenimonas sp.]
MPPAATASDWIVLKFGGTSVSRRERWDTIGRLMLQRATEEDARVLVVVSALSGVTNELQALCATGIAAEDFARRIEVLVERHRDYAVELGLDPEAVLSGRVAALRALADDPRRATVALDWQAELLAQGELLSSTLGVMYLRANGVEAVWLDARDWLHARALPNQNEWSRRLSVSCDYSPDTRATQGFAPGVRLGVTQGFIARAEDGGTAILGRGGSDTSAAYFGALVGARRVEIWTDVPGMFSANPRAVPDARLLARLDYEEAQEIATTGAKVLHPRCIHPCREARVPIWIRDTERPDMAGTVIDDRAVTVPGVKAISTRRGIVLVSMETIGMWQQVGFLADVFERFKRAGLSIDLIGSSETNVTVSLDPSDNLVSSNVLDALCTDLAEVCRVKVIAPCSAVTLVGRGMRSLLHRLTDVWGEFGRERVHLVSQSSNDLNLTFVVDESLADDLLPRLHALLIQSGAMPVDQAAVFGPSWRHIAAPPPMRTAPWWQARRDDLLAAAAQGTPRYVYDLATVRARARALAGVTAVDRRLYALKANAHPEILRALHAEGFGFECVSLAEVERVFATLAGIDPGQVLFTPSFAPRAEIEAAFARGVTVTFDSVEALRAWADLLHGREIFLRLDPGFGAGHHAKVRTGGKEAKFGLSPESLDTAVSAARAAGARITGLHAHIGSGIFEASQWAQVYALLARLADRIGTVRHLDIGGGLGVAYDGDDAGFDLPAYAAALAQLKADHPQYSLWIEPGRFLVAEAGVLLARVTQVVTKDGVRRVGLDAGMNALLRPALYDAFHGIANLSRIDDAPGQPAEVVGPVCESSDVLGHGRRLPDATAEGDIVVVEHAGAYGFAMANTYNLRALPAEEIING